MSTKNVAGDKMPIKIELNWTDPNKNCWHSCEAETEKFKYELDYVEPDDLFDAYYDLFIEDKKNPNKSFSKEFENAYEAKEFALKHHKRNHTQ